MIPQLLNPMLAAIDVGTLVTTAVIVVTLIGWVINFVNAQAKPPAPNRGARPQRPRSERIQSEIEQFMREQAGKKSPAAETPKPRAPEPVRPTQRRPTRVQQTRQARPQTRPEPPPEAPLPKPGASFADRKQIGSGGLGQSVREHVRSAMTERVQAETSQHLSHQVDELVKQHLGAFTAETRPTPAVPQTIARSANEFLQLLKSLEGVRQAMILNEILQPPPGRRRHRDHGPV